MSEKEVPIVEEEIKKREATETAAVPRKPRVNKEAWRDTYNQHNMQNLTFEEIIKLNKVNEKAQAELQALTPAAAE